MGYGDEIEELVVKNIKIFPWPGVFTYVYYNLLFLSSFKCSNKLKLQHKKRSTLSQIKTKRIYPELQLKNPNKTFTKSKKILEDLISKMSKEVRLRDGVSMKINYTSNFWKKMPISFVTNPWGGLDKYSRYYLKKWVDWELQPNAKAIIKKCETQQQKEQSNR